MSTLLALSPVAPDAGISIVAPASYAQRERTERGLAALRDLGFAPRVNANALACGPMYFAGTPEERVADLHAAFTDPDSSAVMSLRGGYGSNYLLEDLDFEIIKSHPKPFFAYSDLTGIQLRLLDELGLPAFHGPMLAADFYLSNGVNLSSFQSALAGEPYMVGVEEGLRMLKPSLKSPNVSGTLYGGCLSIIVSLLGTPWEPCTEGTLLFLEDRGVKPYQVDRMIWQLRAARKLEGVRGIIFGEMLDCVPAGTDPDMLDQAILSALDGFDGPIAIGLRSGHVSRENVTLTFGVDAEFIATDEPSLHLREPAVKK
jgi:muramoyltetrapeptide carboxypeptidase